MSLRGGPWGRRGNPGVWVTDSRARPYQKTGGFHMEGRACESAGYQHFQRSRICGCKSSPTGQIIRKLRFEVAFGLVGYVAQFRFVSLRGSA